MTAERTDRNQEIVRLRLAGVKLAEIGAQFGISKERVRQICARATARMARRGAEIASVSP